MDYFYRGWLAGWARGMLALDEKARATVLSECGRACAAPEMLPLYRAILEKTDETHAFFMTVDAEVGGVAVETVAHGRTYDFVYDRCLCPLHTEGGVEDPMLCECSRESLAWLMRTLFPSYAPSVELLESVLCKDARCRLRVSLAVPAGRKEKADGDA
jgi:hypothetical protein